MQGRVGLWPITGPGDGYPTSYEVVYEWPTVGELVDSVGVLLDDISVFEYSEGTIDRIPMGRLVPDVAPTTPVRVPVVELPTGLEAFFVAIYF